MIHLFSICVCSVWILFFLLMMCMVFYLSNRNQIHFFVCVSLFAYKFIVSVYFHSYNFIFHYFYFHIYLMTTVPTATILGGPDDLYVDKGSSINLTCLIRFSPEPPNYIFWYHQNEVRISD